MTGKWNTEISQISSVLPYEVAVPFYQERQGRTWSINCKYPYSPSPSPPPPSRIRFFRLFNHVIISTKSKSIPGVQSQPTPNFQFTFNFQNYILF
jgi:hypothetical protein